MIFNSKLKAALATAAIAGTMVAPATFSAADPVDPLRLPDHELVRLPTVSFGYRLSGEFTRDGKPVEAPVETARISGISIMKRQVTAADYARCVAAGACPPLSADAMTWPDRPAVKVSWRDAQAYAVWLSARTGETYRLPTDQEWVFAAGSRFRGEAMPEIAASDPSRRWIAQYERESEREVATPAPQPIGTFGANEHGLLDVAGNVWEWTSTCYRRVALDGDGVTTTNCGVRVAEGQHRAYMTDFVRDSRSGGCAVGKPPANIGFRLVRDDALWPKLWRRIPWLGS